MSVNCIYPVLASYDLATTDNGKRVKLENNGKWSFIEESKPNMNSNEVYNDELVRVSFLNAELDRSYDKSIYMKIILKVEAISKTQIIDINTHDAYEHKDGSLSSSPVGFYVKDNFNNNLKVCNVIPKVYKGVHQGLRPNETKKFTLRTTEYPINSASFIIIKINRFVFGSKNNIELKIPTEKIKKMETSSAKLNSSNKASPFNPYIHK
jgi:hypothetical protein